jgi:putative transposase
MDVAAEEARARVAGTDAELLRELADRARAEGLHLTGDGGLLGQLTKIVVEGALEGGMDDHLGYQKHDPEGRNGRNSRNGHRVKTVITEAGRWSCRCRGTGMPASARGSSLKGSGG